MEATINEGAIKIFLFRKVSFIYLLNRQIAKCFRTIDSMWLKVWNFLQFLFSGAKLFEQLA